MLLVVKNGDVYRIVIYGNHVSVGSFGFKQRKIGHFIAVFHFVYGYGLHKRVGLLHVVLA